VANGFLSLFESRYRKLSALFTNRCAEYPVVRISDLRDGEKATVVGMVVEKRTSRKGNPLLTLEDPTGEILVIGGETEEIMLDEVVAARGSVRRGQGTRMFAEEVTLPDIPEGTRTPALEGRTLLLSDTHIGSNSFLPTLFKRALDWVREERVENLVIAGDLVDGIGIYPQQEEELYLHDIHQQFEYAADFLKGLEGTKVYFVPGNHDYFEALPQDPLPRDLAAPLYEAGVEMLPNPARLGGMLVFHGSSADSLGIDFNEPTKIMRHFLRARHLAPVYGETLLRPLEEDTLVVEEVPAVFVMGHTHVLGVERYHGVLVVSPGTFQKATVYTQIHRIRPTVGTAVLLDGPRWLPLDFKRENPVQGGARR
jgi:DNA polymerase II small subunit